MTNWKKTPLAQYVAALLFVVMGVLLMYFHSLVVYGPNSEFMHNMQTSDRTYYIIALCIFVGLPFYFLYKAWRIIRIKDLDDPEYTQLWQTPGKFFRILFAVVMVFAVFATYMMFKIDISK